MRLCADFLHIAIGDTVLVDFSVANFRSFAALQRLSLNAGRFKSERIGAVLSTSSRSSPHLLRSLALLGANGSGKSSLIGALDFVQSFVSSSAQSTQLGDNINVRPFLLDPSFRDKCSDFEITFIHQDIEYTYSLSVTMKRVIRECLLSRAKSQALKVVFSRSYDDGEETWNLGTLPKAQGKLWQQSTRPNASFLSTAVQLNSEQLKHPFDWITDKLRIQTSGSAFSASLTAHMIKDHVEDGCRMEIMNLLREADLGIRDVLIEEEDFDESDLPSDMPDDLRKRVADELKDRKFLSTRFEHRIRGQDSALFDYDEESDGTQRLFEMAGPLISSIRHNYTLVIDELEDSLHPYLVRLIVQMFQNPEKQDSTAQLIFTTHSDSLLDAGIMERDQFWFVEKRRGQSELIALNDYKPRRGEALRLNYLRGRYGGVPSIAHVERS